MTLLPTCFPAFQERWSGLARAAGVDPAEKLLVALSGGADSVLLLHLIAAANPRPAVRAVHVDHGLRGSESRADGRFCRRLAARLEIPFALRRLDLEPTAPSLEARARTARYRALADEAAASGHTTVLTGHHADDVLETLLLRWTRGTSPAGLYGPRCSGPLPLPHPEHAGLRLVRPLRTLRREEVRELLSEAGLPWCEDRTNADPRHTRSRIRHDLLPALDRWCGPEGLAHLQSFARAAERLEDELARSTASIAWSPDPWFHASHGTDAARKGGFVPRAALMRIARPLRRRVLWRLLTEGTGSSPGKALLEAVLDDLAAARCTRHTLPRRWALQLRAGELWLLPPRSAAACEPLAGGGSRGLELSVPGSVCLLDGRRISAALVDVRPDDPVPGSPFEVEVDAALLPERLEIRLPRDGDRFHPLGAPGSKRLTRYLADRGLPREERGRIPLVFAEREIVWVPGFAPAERCRVRPGTRRRVRLALDFQGHPAGSR